MQTVFHAYLLTLLENSQVIAYYNGYAWEPSKAFAKQYNDLYAAKQAIKQDELEAYLPAGHSVGFERFKLG